MNTYSNSDVATFRWSLSTIRRVSVDVGAALTGSLGVFTIWNAMFLHLDLRGMLAGPFNSTWVGLLLAVASGLVAGGLVAIALLIGRLFAPTVLTADGLYVQRALWHRSFIQWSDIQSVSRGEISGWRYLYLKTSKAPSDVGLSLEVDNPRDLEAAIARFAQESNPLRLDVATFGIAHRI